MRKEEKSDISLNYPALYQVKHLYRYRSMNSREIEGIFNKREIYLTSPSFFNDPFESRPNLVKHEGRLSRSRYIKKLTREGRPYLNKEQKKLYIREAKMILSDIDRLYTVYNNFIAKIGIYCLSAVRDDILMWSHYAEGHKGVCLEFNTTMEIALFGQALKVHYNDEYPSVNIIKIGESEEFRKALLTKSKHWEYEQEWRILKPEQDGGPGIYHFRPDLLTGVILGALIPAKDKEKVIDWVENYPTKISLYQAKINKTKYQLDIELI